MDSWLEVAYAACDHAGLKRGPIETVVTWDQQYCANAVYRLDDGSFLKVYGPAAERQFHVERAVLGTLEDHPVIPAPRILAGGEREQAPPYLVLAPIQGETAEDVWDDLIRSEQLEIARRLGKITAAIHRLALEDLAAVERKLGGREEHVIQPLIGRRQAEIEAADRLSVRQRDELLGFLHEEARQHLDASLKVTHFDMAHNHLYLAPRAGAWEVTGVIDWAEAVLGPPEWDVVYLWHWTFTSDPEAMRECLGTFLDGQAQPERFARRCMAALFYTYSMHLLWPDFAAQQDGSGPVVRQMTEFFFPPDLFGPPD